MSLESGKILNSFEGLFSDEAWTADSQALKIKIALIFGYNRLIGVNLGS